VQGVSGQDPEKIGEIIMQEALDKIHGKAPAQWQVLVPTVSFTRDNPAALQAYIDANK